MRIPSVRAHRQGFARGRPDADVSDVKHKPRAAFLALLGVAGVCALPAAIADGKAVRHLGAVDREAPGASVNICGAGAGTLGVRVSAPYRGDDLAPWVRISVEYYSTQDGAWHAAGAGGDSGWFQAGGPGTGSDTGWTFPFLAPEPGHRLLMRAIAHVEWRGGRAGEASTLATAPCEVSSDGTSPTQVRTRSRTITIQKTRQRASGKRGKKPRVVRDHSRHPQRRKTADARKVVDRPHKKVASRPVNGANQTGSDELPVSHEGVTTPAADSAGSASG
jgi:hypothetical protein